VDPEPQVRISAALSAVADDDVERRLCSACADLLGLSGAAIVAVTDSGHRAVLCASNPAAVVIEDVQATLGEGPGVDAHRLGTPVGHADLATSVGSPWLGFCAPAVEAGSAAVFSFPLRVGAVRLGAITFNHAVAGRLSDTQYADALTIAGVVTHAILAIQAQAPPDMVARALAAVADSGAEVHQASGMLAVRLGLNVGEAMVALRALAYSEERPLAEVARDVVAHRFAMP